MLKLSGQSDPDLQRYFRNRHAHTRAHTHRHTHTHTQIPCFYREIFAIIYNKSFVFIPCHAPLVSVNDIKTFLTVVIKVVISP